MDIKENFERMMQDFNHYHDGRKVVSIVGMYERRNIVVNYFK